MFGFKKKTEQLTFLDIVSPVSGKIVAITEVEDEAFSGKEMGEGFAVIPDTGKVIAPFDGTIAHIMAKSKHAIVLEHKTGVQMLIHVGMNTVSLKGDGFVAYVETGDKVKKGKLLLEFDIEKIQQAGYSMITPVIIPNGQDNVKRVEVKDETQNLKDEPVIRVFLN